MKNFKGGNIWVDNGLFNDGCENIISEREGFEPSDRLRSQRFSRPSHENGKTSQTRGLGKPSSEPYKPAYKEKAKTVGNDRKDLPPDLAEIIDDWPQLPDHIRQAITALVRATIKRDDDK